MVSLLRDIRYGVRLLVRNLGLTGVIVLTLALGIGANSAIFSVVYAVLWRPVPYPEAGRLVHLFERHQDDQPSNYRLVSIPDFRDWREQSQTIEAMARLQPDQGPFYFVLSEADQPQEVLSYPMSAELFQFLGVGPIMGRFFSPEEELLGNTQVVVLSHYFWENRLARDPHVIGRQLQLSSQPYTVIGVMPPDFEFPPFQRSLMARRELWVPAVTNPATVEDRSWRGENVYARLRPGVTPQQAETELNAISGRLAELYPKTNQGWSARVIPLHGRFLETTREAPVLVFLLAAVGIVLLVGCANVASLLTARNAGRRQELAIRGALGAGRASIFRQMLTESLLLALAGGSVGLLAALGGLRVVKHVIPHSVPRADQINVDSAVLLFTLSITVLTGIIFGTLPALGAARRNLFQTLRLGKSQHAGRASGAGDPLIVIEVALSLVLLIGAGLMLKSLMQLLNEDYGMRPSQVLTARTLLPPEKYSQGDRARQFQQQLLHRVASLPGVQTAGLVSTLPLHSSLYVTKLALILDDQPELRPEELPRTNYKVISPDYFDALGIPLLAGRDFSEEDTQSSPAVGIVSQSMARRFWPGENPVGKRFRLLWRGRKEGPWRTVVGVSGDVKLHLEEQYEPVVYLPYEQLPYPKDATYTTYFFDMRWSNLAVRTAGDPMAVAAGIRREVMALDRDQPVEVLSMDSVISETMAPKEFSASLTALFAGIATLLAAAGIYSVISYSVSRRTQEIGIRMALGARGGDVTKMVLRHGFAVVAAGIVIGLVVTFAITSLIRSQLYQVSPTDPLTYVAVCALLLGVAMLACYVPAKRASRVDPMTALRHE